MLDSGLCNSKFRRQFYEQLKWLSCKQPVRYHDYGITWETCLLRKFCLWIRKRGISLLEVDLCNIHFDSFVDLLETVRFESVLSLNACELKAEGCLLNEILDVCPNLTAISCRINDVSFSTLKPLTQLTHVSFNGQEYMNEETGELIEPDSFHALSFCSANCSNLETFYCSGISARSLNSEKLLLKILQNNHTMTELTIYGTSTVLQTIRRLLSQTLVSLTIYHDESDYQSIVGFLKDCPHLYFLSYQRGIAWHNVAFTYRKQFKSLELRRINADGWFELLSILPEMQNLELSNTIPLNQCFDLFERLGPNLRDLSIITQNDQIDTESMRDVLTLCPQLQTLIVNARILLNWREILPHNCSNIRLLWLHGVLPEDLRHIIRVCRGLESCWLRLQCDSETMEKMLIELKEYRNDQNTETVFRIGTRTVVANPHRNRRTFKLSRKINFCYTTLTPNTLDHVF